MVILGLNAFHPDAGAALVVDGRLIAAAEEERFCRVKHWAGLPTEAVRACLNQAGIGPEAIDAIAVNRKPSAHLWRKAAHALASPSGFRAVRERITNAADVHDLRRALEQTLGLAGGSFTAPLHHIEHHRAHLASAFLVSPFEHAAVLSLDGFGDFLSSMRGHGQGSQILQPTIRPLSGKPCLVPSAGKALCPKNESPDQTASSKRRTTQPR